MRCRLLLLLALALFQLHCQLLPDAGAPEPPYGEWEWVQSYGGLAGWTLTPESEGVTMQLALTPRYRYERYRDDELVEEGRFALRDTDEGPMIRFYRGDSLLGVPQLVDEHSPDTLILHEWCDDCFTHTYVRR